MGSTVGGPGGGEVEWLRCLDDGVCGGLRARPRAGVAGPSFAVFVGLRGVGVSRLINGLDVATPFCAHGSLRAILTTAIRRKPLCHGGCSFRECESSPDAVHILIRVLAQGSSDLVQVRCQKAEMRVTDIRQEARH